MIWGECHQNAVAFAPQTFLDDMTILNDNMARIQCAVKAISRSDAKSIFELAGSRLLNVHGWSQLEDSLLPMSEHRDHKGRVVNRAVVADDFFNVTHRNLLPFGWMHVQVVVHETSGDRQEVLLQARQVEMPFEVEDKFAGSDKPTVLRVVRKGLDVTAEFVTEAIAEPFNQLGVYAVQWQSLVNGFLSDLVPHSSLIHAQEAEESLHY